MKTFIIILFIAFHYQIMYSQDINDIGKKTYFEIKQSFDEDPCDITYGKALSYCPRSGDIVTFLFEDNILNGIMYLKAHLKITYAESELRTLVSDFSEKLGIKPFYSNGMVYFIKEGSPAVIMLRVAERNGKFYLVNYTYLDYSIAD